MANILDTPLGEKPNLRAPYLIVIELLLSLVYIVGFLLALYSVFYTVLGSSANVTALLIVFLMLAFIAVLTLGPLAEVRRWRRAAIAFEEKEQITFLQDLTPAPKNLLTISVVLWMFYLVMLVVTNLFELEDYLVPALVPGIVLGPIQSFFVYKTKQLIQQAIAYHDLTRHTQNPDVLEA